MTAHERLALEGKILLDKGGMPTQEQLAAMGIDEPSARGYQSIVWMSLDGDPEAQRAMELLIELTEEEKPYATSRPSYGKNQVELVWENAKDPVTGKVYDPSGAEIIWDRSKPRKGQWDMGHIPKEEYSIKHKEYMEGRISKADFLAWYRDPRNYRPELPSTNRSHKYE